MTSQASDSLAAVDRLADMVKQATVALDSQIDAVLGETLNYLAGSEAELNRLSERIQQARIQIIEARTQWQRPRSVSGNGPQKIETAKHSSEIQ